jgi:hypothetical protein
MEQGGSPVASWAARLAGNLCRCTRRLGCRLVLATVIGVVFLAVAVTATLVGHSGTANPVTLTMPCSKIDGTTVGHRAYGLDQVLSASCSPVTGHR